MSGILFLNQNDFEIRKSTKGDMLALRYEKKGLCLVLFYSKELQKTSCDLLLNNFKTLPGIINGCSFAMVNMNMNIGLVETSKNTIAPITYVPDLILFVNGCPFVRYDGNHNVDDICRFLEDVYNKIHKLQFTEEGSPISKPDQPTRAAAGVPPPTYQTSMTNQFYNERMQQNMEAATQQGVVVPPQQVVQQVNAPPKAVPDYTIGVPKTGGGGKGSYKNFYDAYATTA